MSDAKKVEGEIVTGELKLPSAEQKLLAELKKTGTHIDAIEKDWAEVPDVNTSEGMKLAKSRRAECISKRTSGDANRLLITKPARELIDTVNKLWKEYSPRLQSIENKYDAAIKVVEAEKERVKQEKLAAEQKRIDGIEICIKAIRANCESVTIEDIEHSLEVLSAVEMSAFDEFTEAAETALSDTLAALHPRLEALKAQAAEAEKLAEQKAEQDRIAAEQKAAQDKIDAQLKEIEDAKAEAERQKQQDARDKANAEQAEQDKQAALAEAERKRLADVEAAKQEVAQAERDKAAKAEAERVAAEAKAAEEKAEAERLAAMAPDADQLTSWLESIPAMKSKEGKAAAKRISENVAVMIDALSGKKKAA